MERTSFTFSHPLRVRWAEVDRQGVVFNGHYFTYFDVAVTEYWRSLGIGYPKAFEELGTDLFAVKASAEFHAPANYDDVIDVGCRIGRLGRSSLQLVLGIWRGEEHLTSGELLYVHTDVKVGRSAPWPEALRAKFLAYERTPPLLALEPSA